MQAIAENLLRSGLRLSSRVDQYLAKRREQKIIKSKISTMKREIHRAESAAQLQAKQMIERDNALLAQGELL